MLVLARKKGEAIMIGDNIELIVLGVEGDNVRLGIKAPIEVDVFRKEIYSSIQHSNKEASEIVMDMNDLSDILKKVAKNEEK
jgi:carbon storage regulator